MEKRKVNVEVTPDEAELGRAIVDHVLANRVRLPNLLTFMGCLLCEKAQLGMRRTEPEHTVGRLLIEAGEKSKKWLTDADYIRSVKKNLMVGSRHDTDRIQTQ